MKTIIFLLVIILDTLAGYGQSTIAENAKSEKSLINKNKVKEITTYYTFFYKDTASVKARKESYKKYDERGNLIKDISLFVNDSIFPNMTELKYDGNENNIETTSYSFPVNEPGYFSMTINVSDGSEFTNDQQKDTIINRWTYGYDQNNNCIAHKYFNSRNEVEATSSSSFNKNNLIIRREHSNSRSSTNSIFLFDYKYKDGKVVEEITYRGTKAKVDSKTFYKYDSNNNLTEQLEFDFNVYYNNDSILISKRTFKFDEKNNLSEEVEIEYSTMGFGKVKFFRGNQYVYDQMGNKTIVSELNKKGKVKYQSFYKYDYYETGLIKSKTSVSKKGEIYSITNYVYTYYK